MRKKYGPWNSLKDLKATHGYKHWLKIYKSDKHAIRATLDNYHRFCCAFDVDAFGYKR